MSKVLHCVLGIYLIMFVNGGLLQNWHLSVNNNNNNGDENTENYYLITETSEESNNHQPGIIQTAINNIFSDENEQYADYIQHMDGGFDNDILGDTDDIAGQNDNYDDVTEDTGDILDNHIDTTPDPYKNTDDDGDIIDSWEEDSEENDEFEYNNVPIYSLDDDQLTLEEGGPQDIFEADIADRGEYRLKRSANDVIHHIRDTGSTKAATVELLAIVDYSLFEKFLDQAKNSKKRARRLIEKYYSIIIAMANQRYKTIRIPGIKIKIVLCGIVYSKTRKDSSWLEYIRQWFDGMPSVGASMALKQLQKWLSNHQNLPPHDHAMAFTSYSLVQNGAATAAGMAGVGTICKTSDGRSSSVIHDAGDYQSAHVVAHELGHSLGATHDGDKHSAHCNPDSHYVMSPFASTDEKTYRNVMRFSTCSLTAFRKYLHSDQASCLYKKRKSKSKYKYNLHRHPPGQLIDAEEQCKRVFGQTSGFCDRGDNKSKMCHRLWCKDPADNLICRTHDLLISLPGTDCAEGKHCENLECVAPASSTLPLGPSYQGSLRASSTSRRRHRLGLTREHMSAGTGIQSDQRYHNPTTSHPRYRAPSQQNRALRPSHPSGRTKSRTKGRSRTSRHRKKPRKSKSRNRNSPCTRDRNATYCRELIQKSYKFCRRSSIQRRCCRTCTNLF